MAKYAIGVDFGTESGRALLVDVADGREVATAVHPYANGVIDERLPGSGLRLPPDWALQDPNDYLEVFQHDVPAVLKESGVSPDDVIGLGIDFTACTMLPVKADGTPLCFLPEWRDNPHAWVKLWKHHAAQPEADQINETAREMGEAWLDRYGGKISSEWFFPKTLQILDEAPEVYEAADRLIEAADWVVWQLTGDETRNSCTAGYKAIWSKREGFPSNAYFTALDPRLEHVVDEKMSRDIAPLGGKAGGLTAASRAVDRPEARHRGRGRQRGCARRRPRRPPSSSRAAWSSSWAPPTATWCWAPRSTSCRACAATSRTASSPASSATRRASRAWATTSPGSSRTACRPPTKSEAAHRGITIHELLEERAAKLKPGESGLLALDWWNGNRSVLVDVDLTGLLLGATLATKPEEIYRALIEATAYGTRVIIETFEANGVPVHEIVATRRPARPQQAADADLRRRERPADPASRARSRAARSARPCTARSRPARRLAATTPSSRRRQRWRASATRPTRPIRRQGGLRPALCRVRHAARLLRPRRERRDEAAEGAEGECGGGAA